MDLENIINNAWENRLLLKEKILLNQLKKLSIY